MLIVEAITAKITQIVQEHTHSFPYANKAILAIFTLSIFSVHSSEEVRSTALSTKFFLHLQFS